jgi:hypothetical protein
MKKLVCPKCGKEYRLGYDGIGDGCDVCLGVERISDMASDHTAWERDEEYHNYAKDGKVITITRKQAREQARAK